MTTVGPSTDAKGFDAVRALIGADAVRANLEAAARRNAAAFARLGAMRASQAPAPPPSPPGHPRSNPRRRVKLRVDEQLDQLERDLVAQLKSQGIDPRQALGNVQARAERAVHVDSERVEYLARMDAAFGIFPDEPAVRLDGVTQTFTAVRAQPAVFEPQAKPVQRAPHTRAPNSEHRAQMDAAFGILSDEPAVQMNGATQTFSAVRAGR